MYYSIQATLYNGKTVDLTNHRTKRKALEKAIEYMNTGLSDKFVYNDRENFPIAERVSVYDKKLYLLASFHRDSMNGKESEIIERLCRSTKD